MTHYEVTKVYKVTLPEPGTAERYAVTQAWIDEVDPDERTSDEFEGQLVAWLAYQAEVGNFTEYVDHTHLTVTKTESRTE